MAHAFRYLVHNGVLLDMDVPPAPQFLVSTHPGAYTTTRTGGQGSCVLSWERHLSRLCQSLRLLAQAKPQLYPAKPLLGDDDIRTLVQLSLEAGLPKALQSRGDGEEEEEVAITTLLCGTNPTGGAAAAKPCDVYVHMASYIPPPLASAARLAVVGPGREIASAKFSEWVRSRQFLERLRPPSTTELLLSNDGDMLLEGAITNFFVVYYQETRQNKDDKDIDQMHASSKWMGYEIHTTPVIDGVLPGVIRQVVIEICAEEGIPLREVAPSWSNRKLWKEAFVTNSLRLVQHVESVQAPSLWNQLFNARSWEEVSWEALQLEGPGHVTQEIQKLVLERVIAEGYHFRDMVR